MNIKCINCGYFLNCNKADEQKNYCKDFIKAEREKINTIEKETWYIDNGLEAVNACTEELETLLKELLEEE